MQIEKNDIMKLQKSEAILSKHSYTNKFQQLIHFNKRMAYNSIFSDIVVVILL